MGFMGRSEWLQQAEAALRVAMERDQPDHARLLCFTNRSLEQLVPIARRAMHGALADQLPVLPGEVLMSRKAVMAPACAQGIHNGEEPDIVLNTNREMVVRDVEPAQCDLADYGIASAPVIDTYLVTVETADQQLTPAAAAAAAITTPRPAGGGAEGAGPAGPRSRRPGSQAAVATLLPGARRVCGPGTRGRAHHPSQPGQQLQPGVH